MTAAMSGSQLGAHRVGVDAVAPVARGPSSTRSPSRWAMLRHSVAKWPVSKVSTRSPGDSVLTSADSHPPVPDEG